ncbi:MAG: GNAT family N-acetyltransferase [Sediminibacterium sp.]|nr:GNAT family N-acetyltransferase [Sediminibacterium sp.]
MFISGEHIALRAMEPSDTEVLYEWENDRTLWAVSYSQMPFSKAVLDEFVNSLHQDIYTARQLRLMVTIAATKQTIGTLDWFEFDPQHQRAGLGIYIHAQYRRNGYATETIQLAKEYAFLNLLLKQIYVHVGADNTASLAVFEKCGFEKAGLKKAWNRTGLGKYEDVWFLQCLNEG